MSKQPTLSKAQAAVIERMEARPEAKWWNLTALQCEARTVAALVRHGILKPHAEADHLWRLVPEAERVPVADLDIPF